jgi:NADH:ubiquinone oxidoreductase subunit H
MNFFIVSVIKIVLVFAVFMTTLAYLQWVERKVLAHIQSRTGPLRVGPHGLMQPTFLSCLRKKICCRRMSTSSSICSRLSSRCVSR